MFILDAWYVACTADEIVDQPFARKICQHDMVFYRVPDGRVVALEDFCPHRGAPLSLGRVEGSHLVCGYHGLEMGCDGRTAAMPGQRVKGFPAIRSFPVSEKYGFIWVWPGDPARVDSSEMPHLSWAESPEWAFGGGLYHILCDYRLMIDNLMDLTHETYVHASSIGQREIDETPCRTQVVGDHVTTSRFISNIVAPPFLRMAMRSKGLSDQALVDRWQVCHFTPPSHVILEVGVALAGKGGYHAESQDKVEFQVIDFITPETEHSMWYFWGMARAFLPEDDDLTRTIREAQGQIFLEDKGILERQQASLEAHRGRPLLHLNIDAGGVQARKVIERLLARG